MSAVEAIASVREGYGTVRVIVASKVTTIAIAPGDGCVELTIRDEKGATYLCTPEQARGIAALLHKAADMAEAVR